MNYSELKEKAKELGLPYFGIGKTELEESVSKKLAETGEKLDTTDTPESPETLEDIETPEAPVNPETPAKPEKPNEPEVPEETESSDANAAIVTRDGYEVRRYTQEIHGDKFKDLANQFATHNQYQVKLITVKPAEYCKNCGKQLDN